MGRSRCGATVEQGVRVGQTNLFRRLALAGLSLMLLLASGAARAGFTCTPGPYIVFFERNSAELSEEAREILDNAIANKGSCGNDMAAVAGHTDTSEAPAVSRKRAQAVRAYFVQHGFAQRDVRMSGIGAKRLRVLTADDTPERQNRRVEITYLPAESK